MGTWQSAINVTCCSSKRDDELPSDDERTEGEETQKAAAVCVSHPICGRDSRPCVVPNYAPISLPRSVSNATTVPVSLKR